MSLTTLEGLKAFKNITGTSHDSELLRLILAVDRFAEQYCGRKLEQALVTEYYSPRAGQSHLLLRRYPVASITTLHDDPLRTYGSGTLLPASAYVLDPADAGILQLVDREFAGGVQSVKVVYTGGLSAIPGDLEQAAIELVWLARDKGDKALLGLASKSIADGTVTTFEMDWPSGVKAILDQYRTRMHL